jgi:hypothetical protein
MKVKIISALLLLVTVFSATMAAADARPYFGRDFGYGGSPFFSQGYGYGGGGPCYYHHHRRWHRHW